MGKEVIFATRSQFAYAGLVFVGSKPTDRTYYMELLSDDGVTFRPADQTFTGTLEGTWVGATVPDSGNGTPTRMEYVFDKNGEKKKTKIWQSAK